MDAVGTGYDGKLEECRCLPPTPSITMKITTFGIHARLSYLYHGSTGDNTAVGTPDDYQCTTRYPKNVTWTIAST